MVMSTRRLASSATTWTPLEDEAAKALAVKMKLAAKSASAKNLGINFASYHHLLRLVVEGDFLASVDGGDVHAEGDGVMVAGFNGGVGGFARADTLHPVAHVGRGHGIAAGVGFGGGGIGFLDEREAGQEIFLEAHGRGFASAQAAGGSDRPLVHVDHAAVGVVKFFDAAGGVGEARGVLYLEALGEIVERAVIEYGGHGVPVCAAVFPEIDAAVGDDAGRMRQSGEPVNGVDLVGEPLIGNARGVRPEQAELKVLARIEWLVGAVEQEALPVGVLFFQKRHNIGATPAAGLIDVPCHLDHDDVAELAGLDVLGGFHIGGRGAALGSDLDNFAGLFDGGEEVAGVFHGVRGGLFDVGVAAGVDRFDAVLRVLEIGRGDDDGIHVFAGVEFVVVADLIDGITAELLDKGSAFFTAAVPDVGDGHDLEVHILGMLLKGGKISLLHTVAATDDADTDAVVSAEDGGITARVPRDG